MRGFYPRDKTLFLLEIMITVLFAFLTVGCTMTSFYPTGMIG